MLLSQDLPSPFVIVRFARILVPKRNSVYIVHFRLGLETIYCTAKRNGAKESHTTRSHTEAGEKLFSSQRQLLAQRHPPTHLFATGQLYRFATLAIVYKVFSFVPGGVALPSGVRCCSALGR